VRAQIQRFLTSDGAEKMRCETRLVLECVASQSMSASEAALHKAEADDHETKRLAVAEEQIAAEEAREIQEIEHSLEVSFNALGIVTTQSVAAKSPDCVLSLSQVC
jgi:predicted flap endonuclease-1-like 5' DNA nuclease